MRLICGRVCFCFADSTCWTARDWTSCIETEPRRPTSSWYLVDSHVYINGVINLQTLHAGFVPRVHILESLKFNYAVRVLECS